MSRFCCAAVVAVLAVFPALADDETVVFRSDVSLVRVDVQVLDRDNRAITGLRAEDFILREEGKPQTIRNFASENMPVDVLLLFDVSASMRPHVERIASAAHQAFRALGAQDRVGIMVFDRASRLRMGFRTPREAERELESLLRQEDFRGGTDITRGLLDAARYTGREARREARRAIIIVTDDETEFERDEASVSSALTRADAVLCALIAPDAMGTGRQIPGRGRNGGGTWGTGPGVGVGGPLGGIILGRRGGYGGGPRGGGPGGGMNGPRTRSAGTPEIARDSGGDSLPVDDASALETTLARIRQRYALHFYVPARVQAGEQRNIQVELAESAHRRYPDAELRYRHTYYASSAGSADAAAAQPDAPTVVRASDPVDAPATPQKPVRRKLSPDGASGTASGPLIVEDPEKSPPPAAPKKQ